MFLFWALGGREKRFKRLFQVLPVSKRCEKYFPINYIPFLYLIIFLFLFPETSFQYISNDNGTRNEENKMLHITVFLLNLAGLQTNTHPKR